MTMIARLFPRTDEDSFLHPKEIAGRITAHFPASVADWDQANRRLQSELDRLEDSGAPAPVISGHKNLFNNTVYIEVHRADTPEIGVRFFAYLDSPIDVEAAQPRNSDQLARERQLVVEIAECLKYDLAFEA